jgi:hypothetical protein
VPADAPPRGMSMIVVVRNAFISALSNEFRPSAGLRR